MKLVKLTQRVGATGTREVWINPEPLIAVNSDVGGTELHFAGEPDPLHVTEDLEVVVTLVADYYRRWGT